MANGMLVTNDDLSRLRLSPDQKTSRSNSKGEGQKADRVMRVMVYKPIELSEDGNDADLSDC
jgi:hypothetical protein